MARIEFYSKEDKFLYNINPLAKLIWLVSCLIIALLLMDFRILLPLFFSVLLMLFLGMSLRKVKIVLLITLPIVLFAIFYPLVVREGTPLYVIDWPWPQFIVITDRGLQLGIAAVLRTYMMAQVIFITWITTRPEDLGRALERIGLSPKFSIMITMAANFIPSMLDKLFSIREAQKARGSEIRGGFIEKLKSFARLSNPMMYVMMDRANTVSLLLAARGFGLYPKRTSIVKYPFTTFDYIFAGAYTAFMIISLVLGYGFRILWTTF